MRMNENEIKTLEGMAENLKEINIAINKLLDLLRQEDDNDNRFSVDRMLGQRDN